MEIPVDRDQLALGIKQPWVELILRGEKTLEIRSRPTKVRGRIYLYASKKEARESFAREAGDLRNLSPEELVKGMLVGSVEIVDCRRAVPGDALSACVPESVLDCQYAWVLQGAIRLKSPQPVEYLPYGVWFYPYKREQGGLSQD